jgi:hypothetical protein
MELKPFPMLIGMALQTSHATLVLLSGKLREWQFWPLAWALGSAAYVAGMQVSGAGPEYVRDGLIGMLVASPVIVGMNRLIFRLT